MSLLTNLEDRGAGRPEGGLHQIVMVMPAWKDGDSGGGCKRSLTAHHHRPPGLEIVPEFLPKVEVKILQSQIIFTISMSQIGGRLVLAPTPMPPWRWHPFARNAVPARPPSNPESSCDGFRIGRIDMDDIAH